MNNIENRIDKMNGFATRNLMERKLPIVDQNLKTLLNTRDIIHKRSE